MGEKNSIFALNKKKKLGMAFNVEEYITEIWLRIYKLNKIVQQIVEYAYGNEVTSGSSISIDGDGISEVIKRIDVTFIHRIQDEALRPIDCGSMDGDTIGLVMVMPQDLRGCNKKEYFIHVSKWMVRLCVHPMFRLNPHNWLSMPQGYKFNQFVDDYIERERIRRLLICF